MKHPCRKRYFEKTSIVSHEYAGAGCYCLTVRSHALADIPLHAGQFYMLTLHDKAHILPRPISVYAYDRVQGTVSFVYRPMGTGTQELNHYRAGEMLDIQGPLGNGFGIATSSACHIIAGGGIGLAPLPQLIRDIRSAYPKAPIMFFAGGRDKGIEELLAFFNLPQDVETVVCTDDGSSGIKGLVPDVLASHLETLHIMEASRFNAATMYACGPNAMLEKILALSRLVGIPCQLSLERRMACGVRACMGCSIQTAGGIKKVCADGPVFDSLLFTAGIP